MNNSFWVCRVTPLKGANPTYSSPDLKDSAEQIVFQQGE